MLSNSNRDFCGMSALDRVAGTPVRLVACRARSTKCLLSDGIEVGGLCATGLECGGSDYTCLANRRCIAMALAGKEGAPAGAPDSVKPLVSGLRNRYGSAGLIVAVVDKRCRVAVGCRRAEAEIAIAEAAG